MAAASAFVALYSTVIIRRFIGVAGVVFFGAGVFILLRQGLSSAKSGLRLDRDGFIVTTAFASKRYRWDDVSGFGVFRMRFNRCVGFNFTDSLHSAQLPAFNRRLVGWDAMLPTTLAVRPEELAALMEEWRGRYSRPQL
jgi:hypothetical protein